MHKVESLKKITIAFRAADAHDSADRTPPPPEFRFIFGLAPDGMTPFEYELAEKYEGDDILLHLKKNSRHNFFGHLNPPIADLFQDRNELDLMAKIIEISPVENREIVKAMAEMTAHGGGCDCGCGCS